MRQISDLVKFTSISAADQHTAVLEKALTKHPVFSQFSVKVINHYEALAFIADKRVFLFRVDTIAHQASRARRSLVDAVLAAEEQGIPQAWLTNDLPTLMENSSVRIATELKVGDKVLVDGDTYTFNALIPKGKGMRPRFSLKKVDAMALVREIDRLSKSPTAKKATGKRLRLADPSGQ